MRSTSQLRLKSVYNAAVLSSVSRGKLVFNGDIRVMFGFNLSHTASRLAAMVRLVYQAICKHARKLKPKPALYRSQ